MKRLITPLVLGFLATFTIMSGAFEAGRADASGPQLGSAPVFELAQTAIAGTHPVLLAQADTGSGSAVAATAPQDAGVTSAPAGSASPSATATSSPTTAPHVEASDVGMVTKLYKNGAWFALAVVAVYLGLGVWMKVDKKHAFVAATLLGGVGLIVDSIRRGETPNATMLAMMLGPTIGILIRGPNHAPAA